MGPLDRFCWFSWSGCMEVCIATFYTFVLCSLRLKIQGSWSNKSRLSSFCEQTHWRENVMDGVLLAWHQRRRQLWVLCEGIEIDFFLATNIWFDRTEFRNLSLSFPVTIAYTCCYFCCQLSFSLNSCWGMQQRRCAAFSDSSWCVSWRGKDKGRCLLNFMDVDKPWIQLNACESWLS